MNFLTLILQSALMAPLVEFATSTSGHVEPHEGLALGWLGWRWCSARPNGRRPITAMG